MRALAILIILICIVACSSKQTKVATTIKSETDHNLQIDSCFAMLYIDSTSIESSDFRRLWDAAQIMGYTFFDDTIVPFGKVVFKSNPNKFYTDTLGIKDYKIFDSVNIHVMEIYKATYFEKYTYSNLYVEEWEFKNVSSARQYGKAMGNYLNKGYGDKSPTSIILYKSSVYIFQTEFNLFIDNMEKIEKVLDAKSNVIGRNY